MFDKDEPLVRYSENPYHPARRTATILGATLGANYAFKSIMRRPGWAEKLYKAAVQFEEKTPLYWGRTFALSEIFSSYVPRTLNVARTDLLTGSHLSPLGSHLQRLFGDAYNVAGAPEAGLRFIRKDAGSSFMHLEGAEGISVRFAKKGRLSGSSSLLGAPIRPKAFKAPLASREAMGTFAWTKTVLKNAREWQTSSGYKGVIGKGEFFGIAGFQPVSARIKSAPLRTMGREVERIGFLMAERAQRLMADTARVGLPGNSYNRLLHIPFMGGENKGIINELLTKRALPFYLVAGVALPYADYLTGHVVSNSILDVIQQTRVAHAKATDLIPGARKITDWYENIVPGAQYGPIAIPFAGATAGGIYHYGKVLAGKYENELARRAAGTVFSTEAKSSFLGLSKKSPVVWGLAAGLAVMAPFLPGMIGSRKSARELQDMYSGQEPVAVRAGRWWELGTTPWEGNRIKEYRPHWSVLHRMQADKISLYGSEEEYWGHHPLLHPLKWLKDPYYLEKLHYEDRPYGISSPAFSNVPLVGPLLAGTIGKLIKPPVRMHPEWSGEEYILASSRLEPRGPKALPPPTPTKEFGLTSIAKKEVRLFTDLIGLPGFIAQSLWNKAYPDVNAGREIDMQGSRQMTSASRRYYERELGAGAFAGSGMEGLTEPYRRFVQPEYQNIPQANQIPNTMPSWLPGEDYFTNFKVGDPYVKVTEGYARLPGAAYEALHPEVAGVSPEDYPDLVKMSILGDVAPYSVEYRRAESAVRIEASKDTETRIEYEKIAQRVKALKDSVVRTDDRRFSKEVTETTGTVSRVTRAGVELDEYPGRTFSLSSVGYSAADQSAIVIGEHNDWTRAQVAAEVNTRQSKVIDFFNEVLRPGTSVGVVTPKDALSNLMDITAVLTVGNTNINKSLITEGLGRYRKDLGGAESQAMFGPIDRLLGSLAENVSFTGDESRLNPLRYVPTPYHTKYWQQRTPLAQYQQQEVEGTRLRRWQHPIADFLLPYTRGAYRRVVGDPGIPGRVHTKWDFNTMADMLDYIRDIQKAGEYPDLKGRYTSQASRTAVGSNVFGSPTFIASTLPGRDATYFKRFVTESDPDQRRQILSSVPEEMARALSAQWTSQQANIARAEGQDIPELGADGRLYTEEGLEDYSKADTKLGYGDYQRSKEVAEFFSSHQLNLPEDPDSPLYDTAIDYEDVKLKVIQNEGYDMHDFGIFDDRAALLWRKPYIDGAVRELTGSDDRSVEQIRQSVEAMILSAHDKNPQVAITSTQARNSRGNIRIDANIDDQDQLLRKMRRNPEHFQ